MQFFSEEDNIFDTVNFTENYIDKVGLKIFTDLLGSGSCVYHHDGTMNMDEDNTNITHSTMNNRI